MLPAPVPQPPQPYSMRAMAPHTQSALGPLHPDLRSNVSFTPQQLVHSWQEFVVPATDRHGHSKPEALAMPPGMQAEIENIVSSRVFPYRRTGEVWRHAMMRHLAWIREIEPGMKSSYYGALLAEQEILREEKFKQDTEQTFKFQEERLGLLLERGDEEEACMLAYRLYEQMDLLPDTSWQRRFKRRFNRQYGGMAVEGKQLAQIAATLETGHMPALPPPGAGPVIDGAMQVVTEALPLLQVPQVAQAPLVIPFVPVLANHGQPLVDFYADYYPDPDPGIPSVLSVEFIDQTPEQLAESVYFGPPQGVQEVYDDNTLEPQIIACVDWDMVDGDGWVQAG